jgi:hypothetical protein
MCGEGSASPVAGHFYEGSALFFNSAAGEASLAAHPAAEPVRKYF